MGQSHVRQTGVWGDGTSPGNDDAVGLARELLLANCDL